VNVGRRHPAALSRFTFEVELDQHRRLIPHHPPVMAGLYRNHLRSGELKSAAVRVLNMDLAAGQKADVCVLAQISAHDVFHVCGPAETRRVDDTLHPAAAGTRDVKHAIVRYSMALAGASLMLVPLRVAHLGYLAVAATLGAGFFAWGCWGLREGAGRGWARSLFAASIVYLLLLFVAVAVDPFA
jgi:hypothetical protein